MPKHPIFASIGSLIIDDIVYADGRKVDNVLGGGGVFAVYGMRLWQSSELSKNIGYIIHKGFDYPTEVDDQMNQLDISLVSIVHQDKHTTRGLNVFGINDHRDFEYKHPIIRSTVNDFPDEWIVSVKMLHLISSPERAIEIIDEWRDREAKLSSSEKTQFLWEPLPWACLPKNLELIYEACKRTDVISPNHEEIAEILGSKFNDLLLENSNDFQRTVEDCIYKFLDGLADKKRKVVVVRSSKYGAAVYYESNPQKISWIPSYWSWKTDQRHVVDVTGAGNAFCGGYLYGWVESNGNPVQAALYGAVSASYAVEQVGVPTLSATEEWNNGPSPYERLEQLEAKSCEFK